MIYMTVQNVNCMPLCSSAQCCCPIALIKYHASDHSLTAHNTLKGRSYLEQAKCFDMATPMYMFRTQTRYTNSNPPFVRNLTNVVAQFSLEKDRTFVCLMDMSYCLHIPNSLNAVGICMA